MNTKNKKPTKKISRAGASVGTMCPKGYSAILVPTRVVNKAGKFLGKGANINHFTTGVLKAITA